MSTARSPGRSGSERLNAFLNGTCKAFNAAGQLCTAAPTAGTCAAPATGATGYGYDTRGNRTTVTPPSPAPVTTLSYDQANRLTAVDTAGAAYAYNPDGLRTSKTVSSATTSFVWDKTGGLPLLLTETTGTSTISYLYGPGGVPYAQVAPDGTTTSYLHADQLGSIRLLTDATGSPTGAATYDAYGTVTASTGTLSAFGYAGQYTDAETGYQYLRARYYDPGTGQFLTRDPITAITREPYAYVSGTPLNATDPSGLACSWADPGSYGDCWQDIKTSSLVVRALAPDYVTVDLTAYSPWLVGAGGSVTLSKSGKVFVAPVGGVGAGVASSVRAGYLGQFSPPSRCEVDDFLGGWFGSVNGSSGLAAGETWSFGAGRTAHQFGFGAEGLNANVGYAFPLFTLPVSWG